MAERVSALAGHLEPRVEGAGGEAGPAVVLSERRLGSLWQIAAWPDRIAQAGAAAARAAGTATAPAPLESVEGPSGTLIRTEPLKWLLASEAALPAPGLAPDEGTLLDLSHARTVLRIEGPATRELLARLVPIDLRAGAFPEGRAAATGLHHIGVLLHHRAGGIDLYAPRSFGLSVFEHVATVARQFGLRVA
ncbi:MAG: sarcosine oxidase subunit gamma [Paracoccaceae bacterium]